MILPDANEVLPRLWIGTCASCDQARALGLVCLNVLEQPHTQEPSCHHQRILGADGKAGIEELTLAGLYIEAVWTNPNYPGLLVHCGAGVERSPLVVANWMSSRRMGLTLAQAYEWLRTQRPQIADRTEWIRR